MSRQESPSVANVGKHSDIYSLGVVFVEMLTVLAGYSRDDMAAACFSDGYPSESENLKTWLQKLAPNIPEHRKSLSAQVLKALEGDFTKRPTAEELWEATIGASDCCGPCCSPASGSQEAPSIQPEHTNHSTQAEASTSARSSGKTPSYRGSEHPTAYRNHGGHDEADAEVDPALAHLQIDSGGYEGEGEDENEDENGNELEPETEDQYEHEYAEAEQLDGGNRWSHWIFDPRNHREYQTRYGATGEAEYRWRN